MKVFIGGKNDGLHIDIHGEPFFVELPIPARIEQDADEPLPQETYERHRIYGCGEDLDYYVIHGMTAREALEKLLTGYRPAL